jgi:chemotaxis signal transduction protein
MTASETKVKASKLLVFAIDDVRYGLPAQDVVELTMAVAISPLPHPAGLDLLEGIVNFHGELAAAINLRSRFGHIGKALSPSEHFIFTRAGSHLVALRADRVLELVAAPVETLDIISAPPKDTDQRRCLAGVSKLSDGLVFIFDLENFLSPAESQVLGQELAHAAEHTRGEAADRE